jgi:hypothetical protein
MRARDSPPQGREASAAQDLGDALLAQLHHPGDPILRQAAAVGGPDLMVALGA